MRTPPMLRPFVVFATQGDDRARYIARMHRDKRRTVVYVDVDDTLVRTVGTKRIPMSEVVEHVRALSPR
jgi:hypothetical protein